MAFTGSPFSRLKSSYLIAAGLAIAASLWIGSGVVTNERLQPSNDEPTTAKPEADVMPVVRVRVIEAQPQTSRIVLFGHTEAINNVDIAGETAGKIVTRPVKKGAFVKKNTVILQLAMDDRKAQLAEAEAKFEYQKIAFNAAKRLSQKQFQSRVRLAEEKAALEKAKAELAHIQLDIRRTSIRAPIDGFVDTLPLSVGDYVRVGDQVGSVVNLDPIRLVGQVSERNVTRIKLGGPAHARLPTGEGIEGVVHYISKVGSEKTRTFRVDVWVDNPLSAIPEGLTVEMRLPAEREMAHQVSPAVLTLDKAGVIGVKTIDEDNRVRFHPVHIIADTSAGIWLGGLPEKLTLITVGHEFVRDGQTVRPVMEQAIGRPETPASATVDSS
ncbi:MAG: p-hydroxybenzoic acid efflux pump subunit AaeA [Alphaproteobacteria bacterium MarineAlpha3_Bin4]|nr:MAG: p-hydroxybenzoic acid efflux pump subunit AaeA [Alphaproteobacteria bacterium MarineAlpha3_Bin4]